MSTVQIGIIGAMQRSNPGLTELWLRWTGVPNLSLAHFDVKKAEEGRGAVSTVTLQAGTDPFATQKQMCDIIGCSEDAPERRQMPIVLSQDSLGHGRFWEYLRRREMEEVDGPLEWWWNLAVLRAKCVKRASASLIEAVIGDHTELMGAVVSFSNQTLKKRGQRAKDLVLPTYRHPQALTVSVKTARKAAMDAISFPLTDDFKGKLVPALLELAVARHTEV